jgi:Tfp pilus assembly protein PilF
MFVAFNPFYPPDLTAVEARGASPDRSHQALLDEAVTRGLLGLVSFFFLLFSALALAWRLVRADTTWRWQLFFLAAISAIVAHVVEGLTGIPVVSSLMMFWVSLALLVSGGAIAGHYRLTPATAKPEPAGESVPPDEQRRKSGRRAKSGRGAAGRRRQPQPASSSGPAALATYALIGALALGAIWWLNIRTAYADMRFQEGQAISEQAGGGLNAQILGMEDYLATIRSNPREDFYYLNLGRTLMNIADTQRQQQGAAGEPLADANLDDLLQLENAQAIQRFVLAQSPEALMSYAEAVLKEALALNPLNKDHYANLGRLHNFWYSWSRDPEHLELAAGWYEQVADIAPQDVTLINERANVLAQYGVYLRDHQDDPEAAESYFDQAQALLEHSQELDDRYIDTDARLANLYRLRGDLEPATDLYVAIIEAQPHLLDQQIEVISQVMADRPDLLRRLRDAYSAQADEDGLLYAISGLLSLRIGDSDAAVDSYRRAVALEPENLEFRRNYTLVLSDTQDYAAAVSEARQTLALAQAQSGREAEAAQLEALIAFLQQKAAGGQ